MVNVVSILSACITIFSLGLLIIALLSYRHSKNMKIMLVGSVFIFFLIKGLLLSVNVFLGEIPDILVYLGFFDVIILVLLFVATLKS
jgi:hypothetical protein